MAKLKACWVAHNKVFDGKVIIVARHQRLDTSVCLFDFWWWIECPEETVCEISELAVVFEVKGLSCQLSSEGMLLRHDTQLMERLKRVDGGLERITYVVLSLLIDCCGDTILGSARSQSAFLLKELYFVTCLQSQDSRNSYLSSKSGLPKHPQDSYKGKIKG